MYSGSVKYSKMKQRSQLNQKPGSHTSPEEKRLKKLLARQQKLEERLKRDKTRELEREKKRKKKLEVKEQKQRDKILKGAQRFLFVDTVENLPNRKMYEIANWADVEVRCHRSCPTCSHTMEFFEKSRKPAQFKQTRDTGHQLIVDGQDQSILLAGVKTSTCKRRLGQTYIVCVRTAVQHKLLPHQKQFCDFYVRDRKNSSTPFLLYWTVGSGKTDGALAPFFVAPPKRLVVVCYMSLIDYWKEKIMKFQILEDRNVSFSVEIVTFEALMNMDIGDLRDASVIVDEVHYFRNVTTRMQYLLELLKDSESLLLLTATPLVNDFKEVEYWSNLFACKPENLWGTMNGRVMYYNPSQENPTAFAREYPAVNEIICHSPMRWEQAFSYFLYESNRVTMGGVSIQTPTRNYMRSKSKSICNGIFMENRFLSGRVQHLVRGLLDNRMFPAVVYSANIETGVDAIETRLRARDSLLRIKKITGKTRSADRDKIRTEFNAGKLDVLIISKVGNTGMNLMGTRSMHICSPHDNTESENQTKGRVIRYQSHVGVEDPRVTIVKYISTFPVKPPTAEELRNLKLMAAKFGIQPSRALEAVKKKIRTTKTTVEEDILFENAKKWKRVESGLARIRACSI